MAKSVLHTIEDNLSAFSKGQKRIGRYILDHYDQAAFMTASKLGKLTEVSESTVVRFAAELGFDGYPAMHSNGISTGTVPPDSPIRRAIVSVRSRITG